LVAWHNGRTSAECCSDVHNKLLLMWSCRMECNFRRMFSEAVWGLKLHGCVSAFAS